QQPRLVYAWRGAAGPLLAGCGAERVQRAGRARPGARSSVAAVARPDARWRGDADRGAAEPAGPEYLRLCAWHAVKSLAPALVRRMAAAAQRYDARHQRLLVLCDAAGAGCAAGARAAPPLGHRSALVLRAGLADDQRRALRHVVR